jgi:biotin transport system substrate-specific component
MAQTVWPRRTDARSAAVARDGALIAGFSLLTALAAQVTIHLPLVPITGQTFAVLLTGALLGPRLGAATMVFYLLEGLCGLPVFAEWHNAWSPSVIGGVPTILGPTAGYLIAFPFAAWLIGSLAQRGWDRRPLSMAAAMLISSFVFFLCGGLWMAHLFGIRTAWTLGVAPFLPGDAIKALLAACLLPAGWKVLGKRLG